MCASTLVGRTEELDTIAALLGRGERLLTIVGPGGVGKTRLAHEVLERARRKPEDGAPVAWFCDLTDTRDALDVARAVAQAIGLTSSAFSRSEHAVGAVGRALGARGAGWIVLDNAEQVLVDVVAAIAQWREPAPGIAFIVTSREALRVSDEMVLEVPPLGLPLASDPSAPSDAVTLLVQCAKRAGWSRPAGSDATLAEIARRLEGLPLALQLAAARLPTLGAEGLLERIARSLDVLVDRRRDAHPSKATMRRSARWSWDLLEPHEREALVQCSAFRGPFEIEAAERVVDLRAFPEAPPVVDTIQALRERSILAEGQSHAGRPRFTVYVTLRELAAELGEPGSIAGARARHAALYASRAESLAFGADALAPDADQLWAAVEHATVIGATDVALTALLGLQAVLTVRGPANASLPLFERALAPDAPAGEPRRTARALLAWGRVTRHGSTGDDGRDARARALALARSAGDRELEAAALREIAGWHIPAGRFDDAKRAYLDALDAVGEQGDARTRADLHSGVASVLTLLGDPEAGDSHARTAIALSEVAGDQRFGALIWADRAWSLVERGLHAAAESALAESRTIAAIAPGPTVGASQILVGAMLAQDRGERACVQSFLEASSLFDAFGDALRSAICHGYSAVARSEHGDPDAATELARAANVLSALSPPHGSLVRAHLAAARAAAGRLEDAEAELQQARELATGRQGFAVWVIPVLGAALDLARARRADAAGDEVTARARVDAADAAIAAVRTPRRDARNEPAPPFERISFHVRVALRVLARAPRRRVDLVPATSSLVVERSGRWFVLPSGERVDFADRRALGALVRVLAECRLSDPGVVVPRMTLVREVWPGERIAPGAARNRLDVALSQLRKLGLRDLLRTAPGGHLLDPEVPIRMAESPE